MRTNVAHGSGQTAVAGVHAPCGLFVAGIFHSGCPPTLVYPTIILRTVPITLLRTILRICRTNGLSHTT